MFGKSGEEYIKSVKYNAIIKFHLSFRLSYLKCWKNEDDKILEFSVPYESFVFIFRVRSP